MALLDENDELIFDITLAVLAAQLARLVEKGFPIEEAFWAAEIEAIMPEYVSAFEDILLQGGKRAQSPFVSVVSDRLYEETRDFARTYSYELVRNINKTTRDRIAEVISNTDLSLNEIAKELAPVFGEVRAELIAVTESTRAFAQGAERGADILRQEGIPLSTVWNTVRDGNVDDDCLALDGTKRHEAWSDLPPLHVGCRCFITHELIDGTETN